VLVRQSAAAGMDVRVETTGPSADLDAMSAQAAYRVVQREPAGRRRAPQWTDSGPQVPDRRDTALRAGRGPARGHHRGAVHRAAPFRGATFRGGVSRGAAGRPAGHSDPVAHGGVARRPTRPRRRRRRGRGVSGGPRRTGRLHQSGAVRPDPVGRRCHRCRLAPPRRRLGPHQRPETARRPHPARQALPLLPRRQHAVRADDGVPLLFRRRPAGQSMRPIGSRFSAWNASSVRPRAQ
jgi:hypothetical protein